MRISIITGRLSKRTASPPTRAMPCSSKAAARPSGSAKTAFRRRTTGKTFLNSSGRTRRMRSARRTGHRNRCITRSSPNASETARRQTTRPARNRGARRRRGKISRAAIFAVSSKSSGTSAISAQRACISRPYSKRRPATSTTPWIISTSTPPSARRTISRSLSAAPTSSGCGCCSTAYSTTAGTTGRRFRMWCETAKAPAMPPGFSRRASR